MRTSHLPAKKQNGSISRRNKGYQPAGSGSGSTKAYSGIEITPQCGGGGSVEGKLRIAQTNRSGRGDGRE